MTETNNNSCCSPDSSSKQLSNVRILIDQQLCTGCGLCGEVCPFGLPQPIENGKFKITDVNLCTECSACKRNCPVQAIIMLEQKGCGCLWDTRQRIKKKGSMNSCCS
jgi:NAD-dependent dihydropyrimidine dehydrogenase PreA subunit